MALFLPRRWRRQPQHSARVDIASPLARGLQFAWNAAAPVVDANTNALVAPVNGPTRYTDRYGVSAQFTAASSQYYDCGTGSNVTFTGDMTVFVIYRLATVPADGNSFILLARDGDTGGRSYTVDAQRLDSHSTAQYGFRLYTNGGGTSGTNEVDETADPVAGVTKVSCVVWSPSTNRAEIWNNGLLVNSTTAVTTPPAATTSARIGSRTYAGFEGYLNGTIPIVLAWNRRLYDAEIKEVTNNPWQLFTPQRSVTYFLGTAGVNQSVDVPLATIVVAGHAPTANRTQSAIVPAAAITVNAHAPTINQTRAVDVPAANIVVAAHAPTVNRTQSVAVPAANIAVNAYAPTIGQGQSIAVPAANIAVAAHAPTINRTQSVSVPVAEIIVNGYAPTVVNSGILPAAALAELYGGNIFTGKKKKKKKEDKPKLEEMVFAVAKTPDGKKAIIGALPKSIQDELPDPQLALVSDLVRKIEDASAKVQKEVERIYKKRRDDDDEDDVFILLM